jgi:hypothetical protein
VKLTELRCTWQGFAGASRPCGDCYRAPLGAWSALRDAKSLGWGFVSDERLVAKDLDPDRPRQLVLCPVHYKIWLMFMGPRYELAPKRAAQLVHEQNDGRQQPLFSDEPIVASVGALHRGED